MVNKYSEYVINQGIADQKQKNQQQQKSTSHTPETTIPQKTTSCSTGLEVIKLFFKLSSAEHEFSTAHKC